MIVEQPRWDTGSFILPYRLGEIPLFEREFRALILRNHFLDLPSNPAEPRPPLEKLGSDSDVIVTRSHPVVGRLQAIKTFDGSLRYTIAQYNRYHTDLSGDFDTYLKKFSSKTRNTLRRKVRRFFDLGDKCGLQEFNRPEQMEEFQKVARAVSALTYQERLLDAGLPGDPEFLANLVALAKSDSVRAYVLLMQGNPIAYLCCPAMNDILMYSYLGYDPKHAELSPGTVLQYLVFEQLFAEKSFRIFDFTEGQGEHKKFFGTCETPCADICYFSKNISSLFWVKTHYSLGRISEFAGRMVQSVGLKARIKRIIRRF